MSTGILCAMDCEMNLIRRDLENPTVTILAGREFVSGSLYGKDVVVVTITRGEEMLIPRGETTLESGDKVMVIAKNHSLHDINELFGR